MVSTVTQYRSPVRLVRHAFEETETFSAQAIARARKKLMAEIALSGEEIEIDGTAYSRNDASTLLDAVTEEMWKVHSVVYAHKGLLDFLEKETFDDEELKKADAYLYNQRFVEAVSPFFAHSFQTVSGRLLKAGDFEGLSKLLHYGGYIHPEHSHEAYQKIRTYLDDLCYTLRNLSWEKFAADESLLHFIFSDEWKRFLNRLPSSFTAQRDEVVEEMTGIVLRFQHKATWHYLHQVLVQLKSIETNDFNRSEVNRIDEIIYKNSRIESKPGAASGNGSSARYIWWAIWIVLMIVRAATCNNDSSSSTNLRFDESAFKRIEAPQNAPNIEKRNAPVLLDFFDSLSRQPALPVYRLPVPINSGDQPFSSFADAFPQDGLYPLAITNNSGHHCVALYFDGPSRKGSIYEGSLPHVSAVFIRKGGSVTAKVWAGASRLHFLFGDDWGKLRRQADLDINGESHQQTVPVYEFFSTKKPLAQPYLQREILLDEAVDAAATDVGYVYLHRGNAAATFTEIELGSSGNGFTVRATGQLSVRQRELSRPQNATDSSGDKILAARHIGTQTLEQP